jgi:hypothetical protein
MQPWSNRGLSEAHATNVKSSRGIDHLVLASRDLDAVVDAYRRLGFQVGARNRHAWGTENHIVQFEGAFLELISLGADFSPLAPDAPAAPFASFIDAYLRHREGLAMLVLQSSDALADQAAYDKAGLGFAPPLHFERRGKRPDGSDVHVAFSLAFARSPRIADAGFFVCQQHYPENFWNPAFQVHANTARRVLGVVLVAEAPNDHAPFLSAFATGEPRASAGGIIIPAGAGEIEIVTPMAFRERFGAELGDGGPRFGASRIGVADLTAAEALWKGRGIPYIRHGGQFTTSVGGCAIAFEPLS